METTKTQEKKHINEAGLNLTDSRVWGLLFLLAQIGHVFLRRNFGVRIQKLDYILFTWSGMMLIAALADWITRLPLLGAKLDYASFRIFAIIYLIRAIYHLIRAYLEARHIPHRFTRHTGDSYVYDIISPLNLPFFRQHILRIDAFAEPVVMFIISEIIGRTLAPNLGIFLKIIAVAMCAVGVQIINNHDRIRWDQNDSIVLGKMTQHNMKDAKPSDRKQSVSRVSKAPHTHKQDRNTPSS